MLRGTQTQERADDPKKQFVEGIDYYFDDGLMVLTSSFLKKRGYCCGNGCRHCPFEAPSPDQSR